MKKEVEEHIRNLPDVDLLEYVTTGTDAYTSEAVEFARNELSRRGIVGDALDALEKQMEERIERRAEEEQSTATEPLSTGWRTSVFLCGLFLGLPLLLLIPSWLRFRDEGAKRKNRDMWVFALAGAAIGIAMVWLNIPPLSWLAHFLSNGPGR